MMHAQNAKIIYRLKGFAPIDNFGILNMQALHKKIFFYIQILVNPVLAISNKYLLENVS